MTNPQFLAIANALGWTLVHSLWQIALVALLLKGLLMLSSNQSARLRYGFSLAAMLVISIGAVLTFCWAYHPIVSMIATENLVDLDATIIPFSEITDTEFKANFFGICQARLEQFLPYLAMAWLIGIFVYSFSTAQGYFQLRSLQYQHSQPVSAVWQARLAQLQQQLGIQRKVELLTCSLLDEPITFRHFKPVILLPASLLSGLSVEQIEILLLHELAHIRRYDYLVNWAQSSLEVLFFYHPAFWWISRQIRAEREHCCDDLVLGFSQQPMLYAQTLTQLQLNFHSLKTNLAMSATKDQGVFTTRIHRLFGKYYAPNRQRKSTILALLLAVSVVAFAFYEPANLRIEQVKEEFGQIQKDSIPEEHAAWEALKAQDQELQALEKKGYELKLIGSAIDEYQVESKDLTDKIFAYDVYKDGKILIDEELEKLYAELADESVEFHEDAKLNEDGNWEYKEQLDVFKADQVTLPNSRAMGDFVSDSKNEQMLLVANGEIWGKLGNNAASDAKLNELNRQHIETVNVRGADKAVEQYGEAAANGVVEIVTKAGKQLEGKTAGISIKGQDSSNIKLKSTESDLDKQPLFVVDGEIMEGSTDDLDPDWIETIYVLKGEKATDKYGIKGQNGVIEITTKSYKKYSKKHPPRAMVLNGAVYDNMDTEEESLRNLGLDKMSEKDYTSRNFVEPSEAVAKYGKVAKGGIWELHTDQSLFNIEYPKVGLAADKVALEGNPLLVIDGETVDCGDNASAYIDQNLKPHQIKIINIWKGQDAIDRYGDKGEQGVIQIFTKKGSKRKARLEVQVMPEAETVRFIMEYNSNSSGHWYIYEPDGKEGPMAIELTGSGNTKDGAMYFDWSTKDKKEGTYTTVLEANGKTIRKQFTLGKKEAQAQAIFETAFENLDDAVVTTKNSLVISPNPVSDVLQLEIFVEKPSKVQLSIFDSWGKTIKTFHGESFSAKKFSGQASLKWAITQQVKGTYFAVLNVDGEQITKQFVVQ